MSRIGFIGTGEIAAPMVRFLAPRGHRIAVTRRNATISAALEDELGVDVGEPQDVIDTSQVIFLCLRPNVAHEVLAPLKFRDDHRIVSVMAGISSDALVRMCAPASDFVQTIPLAYLEKGGCPLAAFGNTNLLAGLFEPENPVVPVGEEAALNAHFAICALVPGMLDLLATGASWLGSASRDPVGSERYVAQLVGGFLAAMAHRPGGLASERDGLATEGTISLQMTSSLRAAGAHDALGEALGAIRERLGSA